MDRCSGHTATALADGTVLVAGGVGLGSDPIPSASAERYDPTTQTWTAIADMIGHRGVHHTATLLPDGRVLVVGDYEDESRAVAELYTLDPDITDNRNPSAGHAPHDGGWHGDQRVTRRTT